MQAGTNRKRHGEKNCLLKEGKISCLICPLHKAENNLGRRHPRPDRYKNHRGMQHYGN